MGGAGDGVGMTIKVVAGDGVGKGADVGASSQPGPSSSSLLVVRPPKMQMPRFLLQPHGDVHCRPQVDSPHVSPMCCVGLGVTGDSVDSVAQVAT